MKSGNARKLSDVIRLEKHLDGSLLRWRRPCRAGERMMVARNETSEEKMDRLQEVIVDGEG